LVFNLWGISMPKKFFDLLKIIKIKRRVEPSKKL